MRQITRTVYKFEELTQEVQKKVIDRNRDVNTGYDWWDCDLDDVVTDLEEKGIDTHRKNVYFEAVGSHAAFEATIDTSKFLPKHPDLAARYPTIPARFPDGIFINIKTRDHYAHTMNVLWTDSWEDEDDETDLIETFAKSLEKKPFSEILEDFANDVLDICQKEAHAIGKRMNESYEYLESDEAVRDTLINTDNEYYEDGEEA